MTNRGCTKLRKFTDNFVFIDMNSLTRFSYNGGDLYLYPELEKLKNKFVIIKPPISESENNMLNLNNTLISVIPCSFYEDSKDPQAKSCELYFEFNGLTFEYYLISKKMEEAEPGVL